ncbi:DNA-binding transcriptional LysR family regulator [Neorhizobium galegae]|uniref:LysR family transcriptional regulator n=1 Tax=Neorhizobium galegae TaxID=399 RepID=UPI001AE14447|nr:LysR family transcriptional regulator [Neorhizobium galegae]MBP2548010.1 DNA-binding transcriptional LysR family regulator [Neorhizobium galegae]
MKNISWDSYALFLHVARGGGLSGASAATGLSPATLGRRMLDLEAEIGRALFIRSRTGYRLTADGEMLLSQCQEMEGTARRIAGWSADDTGKPLIRLACGTWMAWHLMRHWGRLCGPLDRFRLDIFIAERRASLAYRESDIGLRSFEPEETYLATARLGHVAYAAYRARHVAPSADEGWIAVGQDDAISAYLLYPHERHAKRIAVLVNRPRSLLDLASAGAGIAVLPCFVGDQVPDLVRVGEPIDALRQGQWIVMNNDDRHRRDIRLVVDRMTALVRDGEKLFSGMLAQP